MWEQVKMPNRHFLRSDIFTFGMVYSFYFLCFGSRRNEFNSFWERDEEWDRRLWLIPMLFPLCWTFFQVSLMIIWYRNLSLYMMILSLYCRNISLFSKRTPYVTLKAIPLLFLENDNPLYFYCSLKREKIIFWPLPLIPPKDYCIHSFWSQNTEKRNNTISQMRLRSVYKMRTSILYTATTEQMGYGIISFFVCFSS